MNYAIIENNTVINIAVANSPLNENWIYIGDLPITFGDIYDGTDFYRNGERVRTYQEILTLENLEYKQAFKILFGESDLT